MVGKKEGYVKRLNAECTYAAAAAGSSHGGSGLGGRGRRVAWERKVKRARRRPPSSEEKR